jgi:hypothetical protein
MLDAYLEVFGVTNIDLQSDGEIRPNDINVALSQSLKTTK